MLQIYIIKAHSLEVSKKRNAALTTEVKCCLKSVTALSQTDNESLFNYFDIYEPIGLGRFKGCQVVSRQIDRGPK